MKREPSGRQQSRERHFLVKRRMTLNTAATLSPDPAPLPDSEQLRGIARRYPGRWLQGYARGKLRSDPVYAAAAAEISAHPAPVLDVGCGIGLLVHYLRASNCRVPYLGLDVDERKIRSARYAMPSLAGPRFEIGSCEALMPWQGHVVILDVLHYLDARVQNNLLLAAATRVAPGAALIIRTVLRDRSWRFAVTRAEEFFIHYSRWIPGGVRDYPSLETLHAALADSGLVIETTPLHDHTPFNSYLLVARREPAPAAT